MLGHELAAGSAAELDDPVAAAIAGAGVHAVTLNQHDTGEIIRVETKVAGHTTHLLAHLIHVCGGVGNAVAARHAQGHSKGLAVVDVDTLALVVGLDEANKRVATAHGNRGRIRGGGQWEVHIGRLLIGVGGQSEPRRRGFGLALFLQSQPWLLLALER
ncbi:MAG: hypothetical protein EB141_05385 [Verrucomicrobia bacterium]|nr:hypothetical protein [Verrucomicrobiota bacterium]